MTAAHLVWVGIALFFMMLFSPTRALLASFLGQVAKAALVVGKFLLNGSQAILASVWRAHVTLAINLMPRTAALPSVGRKTTRRD